MKLTLKEKREEVPGIETLVFEPEKPLAWKAGQYMHYALPHEGADDRGAERWFTIAAAPSEATPMITTRRAQGQVSTFKQKLFSMEPGQTIEAGEPEGDFVVDDAAQKYAFIAGGIGMTPFHAILKEAEINGAQLDVALVYGTRDEHPLYKEELEAFAARNPKLKVSYVMAPQILDEASIRAAVPDLDSRIVYLSGPEPMVKSLAEVLKGMGVPEARIRLDDFPGYEQY
jgi:ferredoxin-NADP reductase